MFFFFFFSFSLRLSKMNKMQEWAVRYELTGHLNNFISMTLHARKINSRIPCRHVQTLRQLSLSFLTTKSPVEVQIVITENNEASFVAFPIGFSLFFLKTLSGFRYKSVSKRTPSLPIKQRYGAAL